MDKVYDLMLMRPSMGVIPTSEDGLGSEETENLYNGC